MHSTLTIKDLSIDRELGAADLAKVRGGLANQSNATQQGNIQALFAPVKVANGADFGGVANIQVDSTPYQSAGNDSYSSNSQGYGWEKESCVY